jgi:hypothetical protein
LKFLIPFALYNQPISSSLILIIIMVFVEAYKFSEAPHYAVFSTLRPS